MIIFIHSPVMKKSIILFLSFALCACNSSGSERTDGLLKPKEFAQNLRYNPDIILIDVRSSAEMQTGYISGTKHLDYNASGFKQSLDSLDHSKTYFVYCASGKRSGKTMEIMKEKGFKHVAAMDGGLRAWNASGLPSYIPENP